MKELGPEASHKWCCSMSCSADRYRKNRTGLNDYGFILQSDSLLIDGSDSQIIRMQTYDTLLSN